jgi:hypothetical protein
MHSCFLWKFQHRGIIFLIRSYTSPTYRGNNYMKHREKLLIICILSFQVVCFQRVFSMWLQKHVTYEVFRIWDFNYLVFSYKVFVMLFESSHHPKFLTVSFFLERFLQHKKNTNMLACFHFFAGHFSSAAANFIVFFGRSKCSVPWRRRYRLFIRHFF